MTPSGALQAIWEQSRAEVLDQVGVVVEAVTDALTGSLTEEERHRAAREAHKLAGSVGTLGFATASAHARALEHALSTVDAPAPADLPGLSELALALRRELEGGCDAAPATPLAPESTGPVVVLLIDDDEERGNRNLAEAHSRGLRALLATDLASAELLTAEAAPEVVVLNLAVGADADADAAMRYLGEASADRPVIVLTDAHDAVDRIEVARQGGRGFFPGSLEPSEVIGAALGVRERVRVRGTRILAVDDDPTVLAVLQMVLEESDFTVSTCHDPADLWERLEEVSPDLVVLDFDMPGISGPELCRAIRNESRWAGLPIVFLTSRTDAESVRSVFDAGADDFLSKPFVGPEVVARIGSRLERVRLYRALADTDGLTGLPNRRKSVDVFQTLLRMAERQHQPVSFALVDVDRFKSINDTYGHGGGDAVLRELGAVLRRIFRSEDVVARWGGDEVVVGMYGFAPSDACERLGDLVEEVRGRRFNGGAIDVTLSVGVAGYPIHGTDVEGLYRAADVALNLAKAEGRNRVVPAGRGLADGPASVDVVIVEDDPVLGRLLEHALQTRGYLTSWITDGVVAVAELSAAAPELRAPLLLLDWDLPGLDGLRVLHALRERGVLERMQVIMLTARGSEAEVLAALEAGAVDHVTKPFSVPVLLQRVRGALER